MTRKSKPAVEKPAHIKPPSTDKKRKIDWSTVEDFDGFQVKSASVKKARKKQKTGAQASEVHYPGRDVPLKAEIVQANPFPGAELSAVHMKIEPAQYWESTNRYKKFTINADEFEVGQTVFVKKTEEPHINETPDSIQHWLAKVLEVRAGDPSHVYLRVFWAYRPEDLPGGRQPHHGSSEVIMSNHCDIIDACTVQCAATVVHWDDDPDKVTSLAADQLFWRQTYDINKKQPLSKLHTYCVDKKPCNPNEPLVQCSHCFKWLHARCLEERASRDASEHHETTRSQAPKKKRGRASKGGKADEDSNAVPAFEATLSTSDTSKTRLTVTDKREGQNDRQWDVDIPCLMCGEVIEKAGDDTSEETVPKTPTAQMGDDALESEEEMDATAIDTPIVAKPPAEDAEQDVAIKDAPTSDTAAPEPEPELAPEAAAETKAPRGRGRPLGSTKKRKRISTISGGSTKSTLRKEKKLKVSAGRKADVPIPMVWKPIVTSITTTTTTTTTSLAPTAELSPVVMPAKLLASAKEATPAPAPLGESVFRSGIRSLGRLLLGDRPNREEEEEEEEDEQTSVV